jgi:hypothetical protein
MKGLVFTALASTLLAVPGGAQEPEETPLAEACPYMPKADRDEIERAERDRSTFRELTWYSRAYCVSLAESKRRMEIQNRDAVYAETEPGGPPPPPANSIGTIAHKVEANEAATFAGLWIEHEPEYRVVVAFTRDAAKTLRKYTSDPLFKPLDRPGPSQAELRAAQDRLFRELERFGARPSMASSEIKAARVVFEVLGDLTTFRAAVARGEVELPAWADIREPAPLRHAAPPLPPPGSNPVKAFPRFKYRSGGMEHAILITGKVVLEDGCLRLAGDRKQPVIAWNNEAALDLVSGPGKVRILDRRTGVSIAAGETITLGGNSGPLADESLVVGADPACPGPYHLVAGFGRYERIEEAQIKGRASELEQALKIPRAEALARARVEHEREVRFRELGETLLRTAPETFAALWTHQGRATVRFSGDPEAEAKRLIPPDLLPFVTAQAAPRPIAALKGEKDRLLDQIESAGIAATAGEDVDAGRVLLQVEDLAALSRASTAGKVDFPPSVQIMTNGALPAGTFGEANMQAANRALEAAPDFAEIRRLVEGTLLPSRLVTWEEGKPDRPPTRAQSLEVTRFLVALGFTARDIATLKRHGLDPVRAWVEQNGMATPENRAVVTRDVVVGEVVEVRNALLGDGFRSSVRFRVAEPLKGRVAAGEEVLVRLVSGADRDGKYQQSNEEPMLLPGLPGALTPGTRWLMFLTEGLLAHQARNVGGRAGPLRASVALYGMWPVEGERVGRNYMEASPGSLPELRQRLAPVDRAFDAAEAELGGAIMSRRLP